MKQNMDVGRRGIDDGNVSTGGKVDEHGEHGTNASLKPSKTWECMKCGKAFSTKQSMTTHERTVKSCSTTVRKQKVFQCQYCQKTLSSKQMLLYHDNICTLKTQHLYEQKLEQMESLLVNSRVARMDEGSPSPLQETDVLIGCDLVSRYSRVPLKKSALEFHLFPSVSESSVAFSSYSKSVVRLGLTFRIPLGWCGILTILPELMTEGLLGETLFFESGVTEELCLTVYNSTASVWKVDASCPIALLRFVRTTMHFNIHMNCLRSV